MGPTEGADKRKHKDRKDGIELKQQARVIPIHES